MSFVGPRPERTAFVRSFEQHVYRYVDRHRVKSGLTGWAQVQGLRGQTSLTDRVEWDNWYIENWSLRLDRGAMQAKVVEAPQLEHHERGEEVGERPRHPVARHGARGRREHGGCSAQREHRRVGETRDAAPLAPVAHPPLSARRGGRWGKMAADVRGEERRAHGLMGFASYLGR